MDHNLRKRVEVADVLQDAYLEASRRFESYVDDPNMPLFLWLRFLASQQVARLWRFHIGTQKRDARRQLPSTHPILPSATSIVLVNYLISTGTSPTHAAVRDESRELLVEALDTMRPADREVLVLRHFEELSNAETAAELGITENTASQRYLRALQRLGAAVGKRDSQ